jgi:lysyl-tRNA synthetase class 2
VANGFGELVDATEQQKRLEEDKMLRKKLGKTTYEVDKDFIAALGGLPESSGIALGVDRMVLLFTGARDINEVLFQSVNDQICLHKNKPNSKF